MKVSADQFVLDGERLTHRPTGATFWIGEKDVACCDPPTQPGTGNDYDLEQLKEQAWRILKVERSSSL